MVEVPLCLLYIFIVLCQLIRTALLLRQLRNASTSLIVKYSIANRHMLNYDAHRRTSQKKIGGNEVLPKFCDVCPNHDFLEHYGEDKKIV